MANQNSYRLKSGIFRRNEIDENGNQVRVKYKSGDIFVPTDQELEMFKNKLELLPGQVEQLKKNNDDIIIVIKNGKKMEPEKLKKRLIKKIKELVPETDSEESDDEENEDNDGKSDEE